jgi:hypothetical protein
MSVYYVAAASCDVVGGEEKRDSYCSQPWAEDRFYSPEPHPPFLVHLPARLLLLLVLGLD